MMGATLVGPLAVCCWPDCLVSRLKSTLEMCVCACGCVFLCLGPGLALHVKHNQVTCPQHTLLSTCIFSGVLNGAGEVKGSFPTLKPEQECTPRTRSPSYRQFGKHLLVPWPETRVLEWAQSVCSHVWKK